MARNIILASADGTTGGTSAGLTTADVTSLINTSIEYQYIDTVQFQQGASNLSITTGVDSSLYDGYRYVFTDVRITSSNYFYFYLLRSSGSVYSDLFYTTERNSSTDSYAYNMGGNGSEVFFDSAATYNTNDRMTGYIDVNNPDITTSRLTGKYGMDFSTTTYRTYEGSFASTNYGDFSGIRFTAGGATFTSSGRVDIYGKRKRT